MGRVGIGATVKACALGGFQVTAVSLILQFPSLQFCNATLRFLSPPPHPSPPTPQLAAHGTARHHLRVGDRILSIDGKATQVQCTRDAHRPVILPYALPSLL